TPRRWFTGATAAEADVSGRLLARLQQLLLERIRVDRNRPVLRYQHLVFQLHAIWRTILAGIALEAEHHIFLDDPPRRRIVPEVGTFHRVLGNARTRVRKQAPRSARAELRLVNFGESDFASGFKGAVRGQKTASP